MAFSLALLIVPLLLYLIHHLFIYPFFLSPLRRIPAPHPLCRVSTAWILWKRFRHVENATLKAAHDRLGPVVQLAPEEVSVNCVKGGLSVVYTGGMEKAEWYAIFHNFDVPNMFSTVGSKAHSLRKRILSNTYSKSHIQSSVPLYHQTLSIIHDRLFPLLSAVCDPSLPPSAPYQVSTGVLDAYSLVCGLTMDIVTGYLYGLSASSKFTSDPAACKHFLDLYNSRHGFTFWSQEMPGFLRVARLFGVGQYLVPDRVVAANNELEQWCLKMCDAAKQTLEANSAISPKDVPVVYQQMQSAISRATAKSSLGGEDPYFPSSPSARHTAIASETFDHLAAGFDTSGITLTYLIHEISRPQHKHLQAELRKELLTLSPTLAPFPKGQEPDIPDAKAVDSLPLLHAILWETLRRHPAIPGPEPRVTPAGGCVIGSSSSSSSSSGASDGEKKSSSSSITTTTTTIGVEEAGGQAYTIPGGIRISASSGILHQNPSVFPQPEEWKPERWLEADGEVRKEMDRWFWAFGSGGRMCVGSNLAIYQMKFIVAAIYTNYTTTIIDDEGVEQEDAYTARPRAQRLMIQFEPINA